MTGKNAGSNAGSLAETLAQIAGLKEALAQQKALAETLASREIADREKYRYDVKYWTLEQAEAYPFWPPTEPGYLGPDCTNRSSAGDWCGACAECEAAVEWLRADLAGSQEG